jgi:TolB-like protein
MTQVGSILGTAAYMSPEQARGRAVDKRADIWAFGVLLYEMLTGRQLFAGETVSDTIAAVLTREPDMAALPAAVPVHVRALIGRCLERDPKRRLRDIGDAHHELQHIVPRSSVAGGTAGSTVSDRAALQTAAQSSSPSITPHGRRFTWIAAVVGLALLVSLVGVWQLRRAPVDDKTSVSTDTPARSIVVLPFVNQSGTDDEYFSDGMTDELASALMKVPGLRVAARSSAFTFKGKNADARDVGAKLRVASVLEGTVRRAGSKLRVTAQLVNAADGLALWSERYEREANDVFKVQDDITGAIVSALRLTLGTNAGASDHAGRTENADAHDLYLRGRFLMLKQTEDGLRKSLDYFAQALEKDPKYAPAYAGMAFAWSWLADAYLPPTEAEPKAKAAALKALALDPTNAEARTMIAIITWFYELDVRTAEEEFRRVIASSPNSMDAHYLYALTLCSWKRVDEGLAETARAIALDPLSPVPSWTRATCLWRAHRYDEAIEQDKKMSELDPNFYYFESPAGLSYREKGMYAESVREYQHIQQVTGSPVSGLAVTYARMGRTSEARDILQQFLALAKHRYVSPEQVAVIYANLGEKNEAFAWLERAYQARSAFLAVGILTSPAYDPLRNDPRFSALLKKMNIESLAADR